jgi:ComF family protein
MKLWSLWHSTLNSLFPSRCLHCGNNVSAPHTLCQVCWVRLNFITDPQCHCCGWPFAFATDAQYLCGNCVRLPPLFTQARSVFRYDRGIKPLILRFKHGDALDLVPRFATWMVEVGEKANLFASLTALVPVPLHWRRLFIRRYNQAALLAQSISSTIYIPCYTGWLRRKRATPSQGTYNKQQRTMNIRGAFQVPLSQKNAVQGSRILLVDDVFTTGATTTECARILLSHGAIEVRVLTLARVIGNL